MRKYGYTILTGLFLSASVYTADCRATVINDSTLVLEGHSRSNAVADWVDVIGDEDIYGVYSVGVNIIANQAVFNLNTNFSGQHHYVTKSDGTLYSYYMADFAIDSNRDGFFDLGVVLQSHSEMALGVQPSAPHLDVGLYRVNSWDHSSHFFEETGMGTAGGIGYGEWYYNGSSVLPPMVSVAGGSLLEILSVTRTAATGMVNPRYTYSFALSTSHLKSDKIDIFWGGATCANDGIAGTIDTSPAPVPEPGTMLLFGTGLIGLVGAGRKKFTKGKNKPDEF